MDTEKYLFLIVVIGLSALVISAIALESWILNKQILNQKKRICSDSGMRYFTENNRDEFCIRGNNDYNPIRFSCDRKSLLTIECGVAMYEENWNVGDVHPWN